MALSQVASVGVHTGWMCGRRISAKNRGCSAAGIVRAQPAEGIAHVGHPLVPPEQPGQTVGRHIVEAEELLGPLTAVDASRPQGAAIFRMWRRLCRTSARSIRPRATRWGPLDSEHVDATVRLAKRSAAPDKPPPLISGNAAQRVCNGSHDFVEMGRDAHSG
jgi:hypothetical protein